MKLEVHENSQKIIEFGEVGHSFFIILQGSVGVYIPDRERVDEKVYTRRRNQSLDIQEDLGKYAARLQR